jgi:hypothetical protein
MSYPTRRNPENVNDLPRQKLCEPFLRRRLRIISIMAILLVGFAVKSPAPIVEEATPAPTAAQRVPSRAEDRAATSRPARSTAPKVKLHTTSEKKKNDTRSNVAVERRTPSLAGTWRGQCHDTWLGIKVDTTIVVSNDERSLTVTASGGSQTYPCSRDGMGLQFDPGGGGMSGTGTFHFGAKAGTADFVEHLNGGFFTISSKGTLVRQ